MVSYRNLTLAMCLLFSHCLDFGISDCGFYTPIVRSNCPLKSIESAKFYENGFSPALPFMITLWPHDIRLCCINFNTDNCWLLTKETIKVQRKVQQLQSSRNPNQLLGGRHVLQIFDLPLKEQYLRHISYSSLPSFKCLCEASLCSLARVCSAPYKSDHRAINKSGVADNKSISSHLRRLLHHCPAWRRRDRGGGAGRGGKTWQTDSIGRSIFCSF